MSPARGPLLHVMIERGDWLQFRCQVCDRDKMISGYEACYTYGHGLTFDELRALVKARCGKGHCGVQIGVALKDERPIMADGRQKLAGQV